MTATSKTLPNGELELVIPITPLPAPRPRLTKWGTAYYPATYVAFMKELAALLPPKAEPLTGDLMVEVECVCKPIAKSKFTTPAGDCDNLAKGPMDALTKAGYYGDDRQIVDLHVTKRFPRAGEQPHIRVSLLEIT